MGLLHTETSRLIARHSWVLFLGIVIGCLLGWMLTARPGDLQWHEALTAIGTVGAVAVALWIQQANKRQQEVSERDRAGLYAAYIVAKLERYVEALHGASTGVFFDDEVNHTRKFVRFREEVHQAETDISLEVLAQLIPLEGRAAHRLARGLALAEEVRRATDAAHTRESEGNHLVSDKATLELAGQLGEAVDLMQIALGECKRQATTYAKSPTNAELYGDDSPE